MLKQSCSYGMLEGWTERSFESTVPSAAQPPARTAADNRLGYQVHKQKTSLLWWAGYPMWGGGTGGGRSRTTMQAAWHGTAERQLFHFAKCDCSPAAHTPAQPARPLAAVSVPSSCRHLEKRAGAVFCSHLESAF